MDVSLLVVSCPLPVKFPRMNSLDETTLTLIRMALAEDIGTGDVTAHYFTPKHAVCRGRIVAKETGVLAGMDVAATVFQLVDPEIEITRILNDAGRPLYDLGQIAAEVARLNLQKGTAS